MAYVGLDQKNTSETNSAPILAPSIGGAYTLVDQDGITRTEKDFAGKYKLIYFGFASCPAVCPTELQKIATAYRDLPSRIQENIQPIFITVDPERDTPDVLKGYVKLFLPNLVGLTGSNEQIYDVKKAFKVYAAKVPEGDSYTMDHSSFIYYMNPEGLVTDIFKVSDSAAELKKRIQASQGLD